MILDFFPQGIATGKAFLGREKELKTLQSNIRNGHHTLLMAPRRWGKTSLARNALDNMDIISNDVSFFLCRTGLSVEKKIRHCITEALSQQGESEDTIFQSIRKFFKQSRKSWSFGIKGVAGIEIVPEYENNIEENIYTALSLLDNTMHTLGKQAVLFFDEIQELDLLDEGKQIQGAIREFAQQSCNVVFIFSGSNRRLLQHMFDDKTMPLYELCERILLERISPAIYKDYIARASIEISGKAVSDDVLESIICLSKCHPKRIYNLCYQVWQDNPNGDLSTDDVQAAWDNLIEARQKDIRSKLTMLNNSQLAVLTLIATDFDDPITGKAAQTKLDLSSAAITKALRALEEEDYIERYEEGSYSLLDPLIQSVLCKYERYNLEK